MVRKRKGKSNQVSIFDTEDARPEYTGPRKKTFLETNTKIIAALRWLQSIPRTPLAFDTETSGIEHDCSLGSFALYTKDDCAGKETCLFFIVQHSFFKFDIDKQLICDVLETIATKHKLIMHNAPFDISVLINFLILNGRLERTFPAVWAFLHKMSISDTIIALAMYDRNLPKGLKEATATMYGITQKKLKAVVKDSYNTLKATRMDDLAAYCIDDCRSTYRIALDLFPQLKESMLDALILFNEMVKFSVSVQVVGIRIDKDILNGDIKPELNKRHEAAVSAIRTLAPRPVRVTSNPDLSELLFEDMELKPSRRRTKSGQYDMTAGHMEEIQGQHPIITSVLQYKNTYKLITAFINPIDEYIRDFEGRIRPRYRIPGTITGRFSAADPNCMQIPRPDKRMSLRSIFMPEEGFTFVVFDYNSLELRILTHLTEDETLLQAFNDNLDPFYLIGGKMDLFEGVPKQLMSKLVEKYAPKELGRLPWFNEDDYYRAKIIRDSVKTLVYGMVYGMSRFGLSLRLGITKGEAQELLDLFYETLPGVRRFQKRAKSQIMTKGYSITSVLRRKIKFVPSEMRSAQNSFIQGTAADIILIAQHQIMKDARMPDAYVTLQVHDELVTQVPKAKALEYRDYIEEDMTQLHLLDGTPVKLKVPMRVEGKVGDIWDKA